MSTIRNKIDAIIKELQSVLLDYEIKHCDDLIAQIKSAKRIITCGAGRVGYSIKAFTMRLGHLGYNAFHLGDSTVPRLQEGDLFLVASGSGETKTIVVLTEIAKNSKAKVFAITGNEDSTIGKLSDFVVKISAPTKNSNQLTSIQPMTTLNEQSLFIFFDALVLLIMDDLGLNKQDLSEKHSILE
jgi:6-phospho-3-hexuloisomerase